MGFWMMFFYWIASMVVTALLTEKPKYDNAKPANEDEASFPTVDPTTHVPVIWGKVRLRQGMVAWYGDYYAKKLTKTYKSGGFLGIGSKKQKVTVGYKYYWGQHLLCCHGPATLHKIWLEEKLIYNNPTGISTPTNLALRDMDAYGGDERGGGYNFSMDVCPGTETQPRNTYLTARLGADVPAFRGLLGLVQVGPSGRGTPRSETRWATRHYWDGNEYKSETYSYVVTVYDDSGYIGTSPQPKPPSVEASRYPNLLGSTNSGKVGEDINPAEMLYECYTNTTWGQNINASLVDIASFQACAATLYSEGFGVSLAWDQEGHIKDVVNRVCAIIDAQIYRDFRSGKFVMKLVRGGYNIDTLPVLDVSNVLEVSEFSMTTFDGTCNEVAVNYTNRSKDYIEGQRVAQDLGNINIQDDVINKSFDMPEIKVGSIADRVAWRELKARSSPLAKMDLIVNRENYAYGPGDLFKLVWSPLGITQMVVRVVKCSVGAQNSGKIKLTVLQDVFSLPSTQFVDDGGSDWTDPIPTPAAVTNQLLIDMPWFMAQDATKPGMIYMAERPNTGCTGANVFYKREGMTTYNPYGALEDFTPVGILQSDYDITGMQDDSRTLIINESADLYGIPIALEDEQRAGANWAYFGTTGEWISFTSIEFPDDGTAILRNVNRGLFNTGNQKHLAGERLWFPTVACLEIPSSMLPAVGSTGTFVIGVLPSGPRGQLASGDMTAVTRNLSAGWWLANTDPDAPAKLLVNSKEPNTVIGALTFSATKRNHAELPTDAVTFQFDASTPTAVDTYTTQRVNAAGSFLRTFQTDGTALSFNYTVADMATDNQPAEPIYIRWRSKAPNGEYSQWNYHKPFQVTGLGMRLGEYLGGIDS